MAGPIRVNLGGDGYVSPSGDEWQADRAYVKGEWGCLDMPSTDVLGTSDEIEGTEDDVLFQSIRVGEEIRYRFDIEPGRYNVRILFAEIYWESGDAEMQDIYINGRRVVRDFNIFDDAGHDRALEREFRVGVKASGLEIKFVGRSLPMHSGARACAIEVRRE